MPKNLLIVESPAKAKTIERYLGSDFTVKASYGHVRDLPKGDDAIDIERGFEPRYEIIPDKKTVIRDLKALIAKHETVWLATDEDREGEAISWHLAEVLDLDLETTRRIVFNEITKTAINQAIQRPRTIDRNLVFAQQARRVLDRLVGFHLSPILWRKIRAGLSAGRVQSVAVRLIVEREREIQKFNAVSSFKVTAAFQAPAGRLQAELIRKIDTAATAEAFLTSCIPAVYTVKSTETKPAKRSPAPPFTTSTLQQEASRKLSFSVNQTMRVAQSLYEAGKITYMRTDGVNLSQQAIEQARQVITSSYGEAYSHSRQYKTKTTNAQEAHEAIRPTDLSVSSLSDMDRNEQRLYELIWKRTLASQMADAVLERTIVDIEASSNQAIFRAEGEVIKFDGFLKLYLESTDEEEEEEGSGTLPPVTPGQELVLRQMQALERYSRPAPRYTEASLVKKLEELGIGRPSTYAPTITTVQKREYVVKESRDGTPRVLQVLTLKDGQIAKTAKTEMTGAEKSKLFPTDLGMVTTDFLVRFFPEILDYQFTAHVEEQLDAIAEGREGWQQMLSTFYRDFEPMVERTKETAERAGGDRELGIDPQSGRKIIARLGRYGPMIQIGASDEEEKPRYARLRQGQRLETITLEEALELFRLPRTLGEYEGQAVRTNIGRFGPYVQLGSFFASLDKEDDPYSIELERAIELISRKREADAARVLLQLAPDTQVLNGRWGPYLKMRGENVKLPKDINHLSLTMEDCERLYAEHLVKNPPKGKAKAAAKAETAAPEAKPVKKKAPAKAKTAAKPKAGAKSAAKPKAAPKKKGV
ncbi:MAG: type I DNA topoisomerase [Bacteroidia bacterium]|nr:type I DNA topoisomerase [Bacteroidia bacterium]